MDDRVKTHFEVLFGNLKDYQAGLFDGAFKFTIAILIAQNVLLTLVGCYLMLETGTKRVPTA